ELGGRKRTLVRGRSRNERIAEGRERGEHVLRVLVLEDRDDQDVTSDRQAAEEVPDAGEVVRAVPELEGLVGTPLETSRKADFGGVGRLERTVEQRLGGREGEGAVRASGDDDHACTRLPRG